MDTPLNTSGQFENKEEEFKFVLDKFPKRVAEELLKRVHDDKVLGRDYLIGECGCFYGSISLIVGSPVSGRSVIAMMRSLGLNHESILVAGEGLFGSPLQCFLYKMEGQPEMREWLNRALTAYIAERQQEEAIEPLSDEEFVEQVSGEIYDDMLDDLNHQIGFHLSPDHSDLWLLLRAGFLRETSDETYHLNEVGITFIKRVSTAV